jgi:hypothetical protein
MENGGKMREREILEGLLSGTKEGITTFLKEYGKIIRKAVNSVGIIDPAFTLEELYWIAIEHFFENKQDIINKFEGKSRFSTYLYVVLYRFVLKTQNVREILNATKKGYDISESIRKGESLFRKEDKVALQKVICQLNADDQIFVRMLFYENRSTTEIMNHFKWHSKNTVYAKKNKLNAKLKKLIRRILQIKQ